MVVAAESFGNEPGLVFQFVDDIIGLCGDPRTTGKSAGRDVLRRKRTVPVVGAFVSDTAATRQLADLWLSQIPMTAAEMETRPALSEKPEVWPVPASLPNVVSQPR
ncbi:polyprenyl synthetase family protein [Nocardia sp. NPDC004722]